MGGSISIEVEGGAVKSYPDSSDGSKRFGLEKNTEYTIKVIKIGSDNVRLHIQGINAPQEVVFDKQEVDEDGKKHFYIFDDHPEFIRRCDILDDSEFEPTALMHTKELEPGIYTVFAYHHVAQKNLKDKFTFGMPFDSQIVYFDGVFYNQANNGGDIKINKVGISHGDNSWGSLFQAWDEYNDGNNGDEEVSELRYVGDSPLFLTDAIDEQININDYEAVNDMGFVWLMMEFEVISGSVQYADVAYINKNNAKSIFNADVESRYEVIETVKGMGESSQKIVAKEFEYIIDDSVEENTMLPVLVTNQLNGTSEQKMFTTNISPFTTNNRWTTPQSSEISIKFEGNAIRRENNQEIVVPANNGDATDVWYFDSNHSKLTFDKFIPDEMKIGEYLQKEAIKPNEKFNAEWLKSIVSLLDKPFSELGGSGDMSKALVQGLNGFGVTNQYTVKVRNLSKKTRTFSYVVQGQDFKVCYSKNGNQTDLGVIRHPSWLTYSVEIFNEEIASGEEVIFVIEVTLMTGSNPVLHNAFVIDGDIREEEIKELDGKGNPTGNNYKGNIYINLNQAVKK